ncbi:IPT/TIG domain-containing protein [Nocardioides humilatus]|uniref:IPT/TIG domain-containing protein n=1 Tax=Nocardioides humilatus TaxID=2607660 RepID=UPI00165F3B29|nr:IPT/TIG domain-containing protein [Nocardioides humilatus]
MAILRIRRTAGRKVASLSAGAVALAGGLVLVPAAPALAVGPTVSAISPTSGAAGTLVTITGSGLDSGCVVGENGTQRPTVTFAGVAAAVTSASPTTVTATAPSQAVGSVVDVRVTDCNGLQSPVVAAARFTYVRPVVSGVSPATGSAGTFVTVSGTDLTAGCPAGTSPTVRFGVADATVVSATATSVVTRAPTGVHPGTYDVVVTDCAGSNSVTSNADHFTFTGPLVSGVSPAQGKASTQVTIAGEGFLSGCGGGVHPVVKFGTAAADTTSGSFSPSSIVVPAPPHAAGGVHVTVTDCQGDSSPTSSVDQFTYTPTPIVQSVAPASGVIGTEITVTGLRFTVGCSGSSTPTVTVGGVSASPTDVSASSLKILAPAHSAGPTSVVVSDCDGDTSPTTSASTFSYLAPEVTRVTPTHGDPGTEVKVEGSSFTSGCTADLGVALIGGEEVPLSDGVGPSDVALRFTVPTMVGGTYDVRIRNCEGDVSDAVAADKFTVTTPPGPQVTKVTPKKGYVGTQVTITGTGFLGGCGAFGSGYPLISVGDSLIVANGFDSNLVSLSGTEAVIEAPPNSAGTYDVRVTNCQGDRSLTSKADRYSYVPPSVAKVAPTKGYVGTEVTISGTGFLGGCGNPTLPFPYVSVGGALLSATGVGVVSMSDTQFVIKAPSQPAGAYPVRVINCAGDTSAVSPRTKFTYLPPTVAKVAPSKGYVGTQVTISGTGFLGGCGDPASPLSFPFVSVGGALVSATGVGVVSMSDTQVVIKAPTNAAGSYDIRVTNCSGDTSAVVNGDRYTYLPPNVTKVAPKEGYVGTEVTIYGTGFLGGCGASGNALISLGSSWVVGSGLDPNFVSISDTQVVITAPANSAGTYDIRVTNCAGDTSAVGRADRYTYLPPTVSKVAPKEGYVGTEVTIFGTGFVEGCGASGNPVISLGSSWVVGSGLDPNFVSISDTQVVITAPANSAGTYDVRVTNCAGDTSAVSPRTRFTYLPPTVAKVAPSKGFAGTEVTISGTGFLGGCAGFASGNPLISLGSSWVVGSGLDPNFVSISDTQVVILAPSNARGTYDVRVTNCAGDTSAVVRADRFTYLGP